MIRRIAETTDMSDAHRIAFGVGSLLLLAACAPQEPPPALVPAPPELVAALREHAPDACNEATAAALAARGVDAAQVSSVAYAPIYGGGNRENMRRIGTQSWIVLRAGGIVVVDHTLDCRIVQAYERNGHR